MPENRDLDKELRFHLEEHVRDLVEKGVPLPRARRQAQIELGGLDQIKERVRDSRRGAWLDRIVCDARDAWRALRRTPGTALTAIVLVALVIGGNTTLFSMVHGILSKPARGVRADGLVTLEPRMAGQVGFGHSYPDYLDYVAQSRTLTQVLASDFASFTVSVPDGTYAFRGAKVTANYFDALGVTLMRGRSFSPGESRLDAAGLVAVVSHRIWQEQFHGADDILGQPISIDGHPATIIGVTPAGFQGTTLVELCQIWVPLVAYSRVDGTEHSLDDRGHATLFAIGRLAPAASLTEARSDLSAISGRLAAAYPKTNQQRSVRLVGYSMTAGGSSVISERGGMVLAVCSVITVLTVLIVCANVANLMLARASLRQRETALRRSLGASRVTIVRSLLFEGLAISAVACAAAFFLAVWTSRAVVGLFPPAAAGGAALPVDFSPDWRVASYAMFVALLGTVAFTLPPAFRVWGQNLLPFLKSGEQGIVQGRTRLSSALVIVQLAFAVLLLTSAGLAYRSISLISTRDLGFASEHLILATISTTGASTTSDASFALLERVRDRLRVAPGIHSVSYARSVPTMPGALWPDQPVSAAGASTPVRAWVNNVGPEYLRTLGLSPIAGREFSAGDRAAGTVAMINRDLAETLWPGQSAIGRTLLMGTDRMPVEVVGVTPNALFSGYVTQTHPVFVLLAQRQRRAPPGAMSFYVRHTGTLEAAVGEIRRALRDVDPRIPIVYMRTLDTELDTATWPVRFIYVVLTLFAGASLLIATTGQYAVIAFDVRRRTRDFGVRMALGASSRQIVGSVLRQGLVWSAVGLALGLALSIGVGQALRSVLFGVTPTDTPTLLGVFAVLLAASMLACLVPARRAARIDPMQALRHD